ncbi:MAG: TRAP transporter small permease [Desulfovibrionales bacterium]
MEKRTGILDRLGTIMKVLAAIGLMAMALLTGADVLGRTLWNTPVFGTEEIVSIFAALVVGFSLPYTHRQGSHIGVEFFVQRISSGKRRSIEFITNLASSVLFTVVAWQMVLYGLNLKRSDTVSMNLGLPTYYVLFVLGFCFLVFALFLFRDVVRGFPRTGGRG